MGIQSEINRISNLRNRFRSKLIDMGLLESDSQADLEDCVEVLEAYVPAKITGFKLDLDTMILYQLDDEGFGEEVPFSISNDKVLSYDDSVL